MTKRRFKLINLQPGTPIEVTLWGAGGNTVLDEFFGLVVEANPQLILLVTATRDGAPVVMQILESQIQPVKDGEYYGLDAIVGLFGAMLWEDVEE